jgi:hypothetical protein
MFDGDWCSKLVNLNLINGPVENTIVFVAFADQEIVEDLMEIGIIRLVLNAKRVDIIEMHCGFFRKAITKFPILVAFFFSSMNLPFCSWLLASRSLPKERTVVIRT